MIFLPESKKLLDFYWSWGKIISMTTRDLINQLKSNGWSYLSSGRNRIVFKKGERVCKVARNLKGECDNHHESATYFKHKDKAEIKFAKCCLVGPLLVMEYVEECHTLGKFLPRWTDFVDCGQVGYTKEGKLVVYDYRRF